MVAKYVGGDAPRLHRMGGSDWARATAKVKRAVRDMAGELVRLYTVRLSVPGHAFGPDTPWQQELEDAFPHEETTDQLSAIDEVKADMKLPKPMDRLICGDVGFGKTEIAVRAAFKAVMEGKQVAVLVPTTLLAEQHFITFSERFAPFPVTVRMLSRFVSHAEQKQVVEDVQAGKVDVVIGTHRLLGKDMAFQDLGLLVVDEEQRFGVAHKERLKQFRASVDVLTMTATPIPRTLEMALTGIREMSTIDTPPEDRQPVLTYVGSYDEGLALGAVRRELLREGQVFWVHNRVATIDRQAAWLQEQLPEARVVVAHGQMDEALLERQMMTVLEPRGRRAGLDRDHRERPRRAEREHARRRSRRPARARADVPAARPRGPLDRASVRVLLLPAPARDDRGGAGAARDDQRAPGARLGLQDRDEGPRDPRRREHARRRAVGPHRGGRLRRLRAHPAGVDGRDEGRGRCPRSRSSASTCRSRRSCRRGGSPRRRSASSCTGASRSLPTTRPSSGSAPRPIDRYGALPDEVETLFAIASLRVAARALGVEEISTFRDQVRLKPVTIPDALLLDLEERVYGASYRARVADVEPRARAGLREGSRRVRGTMAARGRDRRGAALPAATLTFVCRTIGAPARPSPARRLVARWTPERSASSPCP